MKNNEKVSFPLEAFVYHAFGCSKVCVCSKQKTKKATCTSIDHRNAKYAGMWRYKQGSE